MASGLLRAATALGLIFAASQGCSNSSGSQADDPRADLSDTDADTSGIKGSETYGEYDERRDDLGGVCRFRR